ncbi:hypothetical protein QBC42DRAFT_278542 [Cladorrhinum samala]|uniref:Fungal N-terminal domain-containing protein n=1 Tax=Cladorrhinum samala TaxID=585594 RepID=A0AAV9HA49_9PEZI|nr:hypothetical protein QBC42DRAFT_278542 [Cladorrhinum samala]
MDPVAALGAAAAGIQIVGVAAKALLTSIKLVRDLRDAPDRVRSLLNDVENSSRRVSHLCMTLLQPGAKLRNALSPDQYARLSPCAQQVRQAMTDADSTLSKLCGPSNPSGQQPSALRRTWKAALALVRHEEITEKLDRVDRSNLELLRELQVIGVEIQATSTELSTQILASVDSKHSAVSRRLDDLDNASRDLKATIGDSQDTISHNLIGLQRSVQGIQTDMSQSRTQTVNIADDITKLRAQGRAVSDSLDNIVHSQGSQSSELQQLQQEARLMRDEIRAMGSNLINIMTANADAASHSRLGGLDALNAEERAVMERGVRRHFVQKPSALRDAHRIARGALHLFQECNCRTISEKVERRMGRFSVIAGTESKHGSGCPLYNIGQHSWYYSLTAQLLPFINKTVEFTVGVTHQAGWSSVMSPLRFRGTVRRAKSPIFQLFDALPKLYAHEDVPNFNRDIHSAMYYGRSPKSDFRIVQLKWDVERTRDALENIYGKILWAVESGIASGADVDEMGHTFLSAVCILALSMGPGWHQFCGQLEALMSLAVCTGSDIWQPIPRSFMRDYHLSSDYRIDIHGSSSFEGTITPMSLLFIGHISREAGALTRGSPIPAYPECRRLGLLESCTTFLPTMGSKHYFLLVKTSLSHLLRTPDLAEGAGYDDLSVAVLNRRFHDVQKLAKPVNNPGQCDQPENLDTFSLLELALGWEEGLSYLVSLNFCPIRAIQLAFYMHDKSSLRILLRTKAAIFGPIPSHCGYPFSDEQQDLWLFDIIFDDPSVAHETLSIVIKELARRRETLKRLAIDILAPDEQLNLGLPEAHILDGKVQAAYQLLRGRVNLPHVLEYYGIRSPYHFGWYRLSCTSYLDTLFDAGFRCVDLPDMDNRTPLHKVASSLEIYGRYFPTFEKLASAALWLLDHGANPLFHSSGAISRWPTFFFYLAVGFGQFPGRHSDGLRWLAIQASAFRSTLSPFDALLDIRHNCGFCFCSDTGCVALPQVWHRTFLGKSQYWNRAVLLDLLCRALGVDEGRLYNILGAICRLELFERLGMVHTCCRSWDWWDDDPQSDSEAECQRLHEEDGHLNNQLDLLMAEYQHSSKKTAVTSWEFWDSWWWVVDMILPPLIVAFPHPELASYQARAKREQQALVSCGYDTTLDFLDIIRLHFEKYRRGLTHGEWPDDHGKESEPTNNKFDSITPTDGHTRRSSWVEWTKEEGWKYTDMTAIAAAFDVNNGREDSNENKEDSNNIASRNFKPGGGKCTRLTGYRMLSVSAKRSGRRRRVRFDWK